VDIELQIKEVPGFDGTSIMNYLVSIHKWSFCPISALCSKNNPLNINYIPAVIFFACLDIEQKSSFLGGHYLLLHYLFSKTLFPFAHDPFLVFSGPLGIIFHKVRIQTHFTGNSRSGDLGSECSNERLAFFSSEPIDEFLSPF